MHRRTTLQHTLVAALAATAVVASPALARPVDRVDRYDNARPAPHQDLRGEHARDAARAAEHPPFQLGRPTWRAYPSPTVAPAKSAPVKAPASDHDNDIWLALGAGIAATGIVAGSAVGVSRRRRLRARRAIA